MTTDTHLSQAQAVPAAKYTHKETVMNPGLGRTLVWLLLYIGLALTPMFVALVGERPPPRGLLVEIGAMLGLGVLSLQLVMSGRYRWFGAGFGQDNLLQFHRQTGQLAWLLVLTALGVALLIAG